MEDEEEENEEEDEEDETDGWDEDEWGVAVSMTSPEEEEDAEGNRYSMSPCLQGRWDKK